MSSIALPTLVTLKLLLRNRVGHGPCGSRLHLGKHGSSQARLLRTASMKSAIFSVLLISGAVAAQPSAPLNQLNETLRAMARPGASSVSLSAQLVDEMMSLAPSDSQPSRGALAGFANDFTAALIGKDLTDARVTTLQRCVADVLSGSGTNEKPAKLLRDTLTAMAS